MQQRHLDRYAYFNDLAVTSRDFYIGYLGKFIRLYPGMKVLELGCGEGGNLLPFAEAGCEVTGIDIVKTRIEQAVEFFARKKAKGTFICSDIADVSEDIGKFELIVIHDVIEHIPGGGEKLAVITKAKSMLKDGGIIFWGFPAWQMPFGGHQQICRNRILSHLPYIHLLPAPLYKLLLRMGKEDDSCVRELLSIKSCGVSIEQFERMMRQTGSEVIDKIYWFINPHYKRKFGFTPKKLYGWVGKLKYLRNYFCTSCFYLSR